MQELPGGTPGQTYGTGQSYDDDQAQRHGRPPRRPDRDDDDDDGRPGGGGGGPGGPPERGPNDLLCRCRSRISCRCSDDCGLPDEATRGSIRRLLQELEAERDKPPRFPGSPADARGEFEKALQEGEKEYQGIDAVVTKYRAFHCQIECDLERARTWCEDLAGWCQVDPQVRRRITRLWRRSYERRERRLHRDWTEAAESLDETRDCVEQSGRRVDEARRVYEGIRDFEKTLKDRFAELKALYDRARAQLDAKDYKAVCAILLEYRKCYERLDDPPPGATRPGAAGGRGDDDDDEDVLGRACNPPDEGVRALNGQWLREQLVRGLRKVLVARYCRFCWQQQRIDLAADAEARNKAYTAFVKRRRDDFIMEARDVEDDDDGGRPGGRGGAAQAGDE